MAMTATLACSPTSLKAGPNGKTSATLTVSNSGAVDVYVTGIHTWVNVNGDAKAVYSGALQGQPVFGGDQGKVVAGSNTKFYFEAVLPEPRLDGAQDTFDVNARVKCDDGTVVVPTAVTLTVDPAGA